MPGYTAKAADDDGKEVLRGTVGKLAVIGPTGCRVPGRRPPGQLREGRLELAPATLYAVTPTATSSHQARADDMIITAGCQRGRA
ncbi:hypothetical protein [Candidatus Skiveiella danica]|uniref:hypothetical protein n=1 Tax=Candidatus Skiveiella danica TaxID=3386177 RepID=UPI0039B8E726